MTTADQISKAGQTAGEPPSQDVATAAHSVQAVLRFVPDYSEEVSRNETPQTAASQFYRVEDALIFCSKGERLNISNADLQALALRYQKWVAREDKGTDFELFFSDLNKASGVGVVILREIVALLMFSEAALKEVHRRRSEDIGARLFPLLPIQLLFREEGGKPEYSVRFSRSEDAIVFEKQERTVVLSDAEIRPVWHLFLEWWCFHGSGQGGLRDSLHSGWSAGDARKFYAFELASLMFEAEMWAHFKKR